MKIQIFLAFVATAVSTALGLQATTTVRELPFLNAIEQSKYRTNSATKRYYDGQEGACGCGTSSGAFSWQLGISSGVYTAAASQAIYDSGGKSWCESGCDKCYKLTSTGTAPCSGCGSGGAAGQSINVMVTNLCPHNGNEQWCPAVGGTNNYGYSYHFDIMAKSPVLGDNPVVNFEQASCPSAALSDYK